MFSSNAVFVPNLSAITEWSITNSAGASGFTFAGSPPSSTIASRIVARSTTQGTPVKSCMITRAGVNWISVSGSESGFQLASASICAAVMFAPSSVRSKFSSKTFKLKGSVSAAGNFVMSKISYLLPATSISTLALKEFLLMALS